MMRRAKVREGGPVKVPSKTRQRDRDKARGTGEGSDKYKRDPSKEDITQLSDC